MTIAMFLLDTFRGVKSWPQTEATTQSCTWNSQGDDFNDEDGIYQVSFSYFVDGEYHASSIQVPGQQHSQSPYSCGDTLIVVYNPHNPDHGYRPALERIEHKRFRMLRLIVAICGVILFLGLLVRK